MTFLSAPVWYKRTLDRRSESAVAGGRRGGCKMCRHSGASVECDRTVGAARDRRRQPSLRHRQQPRRKGKQTDGSEEQTPRLEEAEKEIKIQGANGLCILPPTPANTGPSRVNVTGSVYYLRKWAEGRGKPSLGESGTSIFIE